MSHPNVAEWQPSQNQAVIGSLRHLLEMFDRLFSKGPIAFSCIQESLSLLLPTNNQLFKIFLRRLNGHSGEVYHYVTACFKCIYFYQLETYHVHFGVISFIVTVICHFHASAYKSRIVCYSVRGTNIMQIIHRHAGWWFKVKMGYVFFSHKNSCKSFMSSAQPNSRSHLFRDHRCPKLWSSLQTEHTLQINPHQ